MRYTYQLSDFVGLTESAPDQLSLDDAVRKSQITIAFDGTTFDAGGFHFDFKATLDATDEGRLDAIIAAHTGEATVEAEHVDPRNGYHVVAVSPYAYSEEDSKHVGQLFNPVRGATSFHDIQVTTEVFIQGAKEYLISNGIDGDIVEFSVVDKDDVLGLFATYGLTVGVHVLEVAKFLETFHVEPGTHRGTLESQTAGQVLPGLYMRIKYESAPLRATPDPGQIRMNVLLHWYEE